MQTTASRMKVLVYGLVQGMGFRPYVYNLARKLQLRGFVRNNAGIVEIEVEGPAAVIDVFLRELPEQAPSLACISKVETQPCESTGNFTEFAIAASLRDRLAERHVAFDVATCSDCLNELFSPIDRRYQYPFINCINCGPRFTIIESLPYDRASTTMKSFRMCNECEAEYNDPANRRFHAQPIGCSSCGPKLIYRPAVAIEDKPATAASCTATLLQDREALAAARDALLHGQVIAIKGLGGYHLMGDARKAEVVEKIRLLKSREARPLAVMFASVEVAERHCCLSEDERSILASSQRPILLLRRRDDVPPSIDIDPLVAPGLDEIGAMLPYTPLHHLLLRLCDFPLVATSANERGVPIITCDNDALREFTNCGVLFHDRKIHSGYDDSIQRVVAGTGAVLRRARGFAPAQLDLPFESTHSILAVGAHLKNTFCLAKDTYARMSQHLGDIDTLERLNNYERTLQLYEHLFDIQPQVIAHDLHPNYQTSILAEKLAKSRNLPLIGVQHHHAHAVSVMAEYQLKRALAVVFDGLGFGSDGNLWGGEFLLAEYDKFQRLANFENVPMPGGEAAVKYPWRMALGFTKGAAAGFAEFVETLRALHGQIEVATVLSQLERNLNTPLTSSCGRLFDAAAALVSPGLNVSYEGQAAMQFEALARQCVCPEIQAFDFELQKGNPHVVKTTPILVSMQSALRRGLSAECAARAFHETIVRVVVEVLSELSNQTGVATVCLSGGVFQNRLLSESLKSALMRADFAVFLPSHLPCNDGGLSFGQAVVGLSKLNEMNPNCV